jgi:type IV pilus assembly protein PilN
VNSLEPLREKDGHISVHLRVAGPRDRALELTRNLEGSRHFLLPRIVSESAETNGTAAEKMAPISLSSPVNFDLLADYNPAPELRHAHVAEKKSAQPKDQLQPLKPHPGPPAAPGPKSSRPPYLGPPIQPGSKLSKQPGGRP